LAGTAQTPTPTQAPTSKGFEAIWGKALVSGTGANTQASAFWATYFVGLAVLSFVLAFTIGRGEVITGISHSLFGGGPRISTETVLLPVGYVFIVIGIIALICAPIVYSIIQKTNIAVYENGVVGTGISKWFYWGDFRTFQFQCKIEQASIDLRGNQLVVHGPGTNYLVYAANGLEIQRVLVQQQNQTSAAQ